MAADGNKGTAGLVPIDIGEIKADFSDSFKDFVNSTSTGGNMQVGARNVTSGGLNSSGLLKLSVFIGVAGLIYYTFKGGK